MTTYTSVLDRHYSGIFEKMTLVNGTKIKLTVRLAKISMHNIFVSALVPVVFDSFLSVIRSLLSKENAQLLKSYGPNKNEWLPVLARDIDQIGRAHV